MCDKETKRFFKIEYLLQATILAILGWTAIELIDMRDRSLAVDKFHATIPNGFFTQSRWGLSDELKAQAEFQHKIDLIDKKISLIGLQHQAHLDEAKIWKDMIRDLAEHAKTHHNPNNGNL